MSGAAQDTHFCELRGGSTANVVVEGPRASARNTRCIPTITHGWVVIKETERFVDKFITYLHASL